MSATLSVEFSMETAATHTISVTEATTKSVEFHFPSEGFYQTWQLVMTFKPAATALAWNQNTDNYQALSFSQARSLSTSDLQAMTRKWANSFG